ncbi:hypothetical protein ZHAS_00001091 [Anopheles sinensis]|uniref:Uncharacterized protein n=1 Tax=Anopheles sinensis TaxID=74873 RepID=A0A084VB20_ANOSI|nr:hypothetical protein ZHAS_00001091 [Anopheles sinensis]
MVLVLTALPAVKEGGLKVLAAVKEGGLKVLVAVKEGGLKVLAAMKEGGLKVLAAVKEGGLKVLAAVKEGGLKVLAAMKEGGLKVLAAIKKYFFYSLHKPHSSRRPLPRGLGQAAGAWLLSKQAPTRRPSRRPTSGLTRPHQHSALMAAPDEVSGDTFCYCHTIVLAARSGSLRDCRGLGWRERVAAGFIRQRRLNCHPAPAPAPVDTVGGPAARTGDDCSRKQAPAEGSLVGVARPKWGGWPTPKYLNLRTWG